MGVRSCVHVWRQPLVSRTDSASPYRRTYPVFAVPASHASETGWPDACERSPLVRQLHRCEFMEKAENVVLIGVPGTGKTHLASAIRVRRMSTIGAGILFFSTLELAGRWPTAGPTWT